MGRYEVLFRIAAGGMAEVYAARATGEAGFQKLVAVKRMLPTLADDEEFVIMFLDEARVAANISSPNVVQTLDLGRDSEGALYIAMELVVGVTLSRIIKEAAKVRRAVPVAMSVELIAQAAQGLDAAHNAVTPVGEALEIVHRDVSPQNILIGIDGRARITDFGVARALLRTTETNAGQIKGKFAYCSPEQLRSENIDRRADIFALGVVAWEALAGQRLFVAEHPLATMERVQNMPILPVHQVRSRVPEPISMVIAKALERNPDARFATAMDFAHALRDAAVEAGIVLPSQADVSAFIKAAGGEPLQKMRGNIRSALQEGGPDPMDADDGPTSVISASGTRDTDVNGRRSELSHPEPDSSGVARMPGSLFPVPEESPPAPSRRSAYLFTSAALLVSVVFGVALSLAMREATAPEGPPATTPTSTESAAPSEPPDLIFDESVLDEEMTETPTPEAESAEASREETPPDGVAVGDIVLEPTSAPRLRRERPRPQGASESMRPAEPVSVAAPAMEATPRLDPTPQPPAMEAAPMRRGPLVGLEAFDRELEGD